jgi:hypothetical protein
VHATALDSTPLYRRHLHAAVRGTSRTGQFAAPLRSHHTLRPPARPFARPRALLQLFNKPTKKGTPGVDVYEGCNIDYKGKVVTAQLFLDVLTGNAAGVPAGGKVLKSGPSDKVRPACRIVSSDGCPRVVTCRGVSTDGMPPTIDARTHPPTHPPARPPIHPSTHPPTRPPTQPASH